MSPLIFLIVAVTAFSISAWFTHRFFSPNSIVFILDHPNDRSLHDRPVPRGGGLAILIAIVVCGATVALFYHGVELVMIAAGISIVSVVSFFDDRYSILPLYRLGAHVSAAALILYGGLSLQKLEIAGASWHMSYAIDVGFSVLFIVWMTNLYNFMDGMDGFAGGMAVSGFGTLAAMGSLAGHDMFFVTSLIIAAASAGFLVFNFPPARIFMGDLGSSTLGFLAAVLSLWGARDGIFPFWAAVLVFSPFIMDATVTLIRRLARHEKVWEAHKTHCYQILVQAGWGHRKTVLFEYGIMFGCGITALYGVHATAGTQLALLTGWAFFYLIFFFWTSRMAVQHT